MTKTCEHCGAEVRAYIVAFIGKRWFDKDEQTTCPDGKLHSVKEGE